MKASTSGNHYYLLIGIMAIASILRFHHIGQPLIDATSWRETDVAGVANSFYQGNWNIFYPEVSWNGPGPSYQGMEFQTVSYISALLYRFVGQHDWVGRSVAVVFGLWGIFAFYQFVSRVWNKEHALAGSAFLAILPGNFYIDRLFTPDSAMLALVMTGCWFLTVYLQTERRRYLVLAGLIGGWGFLTKLPGMIVGIPMLYAILAIPGSREMPLSKRNTTIFAAGVLTVIPVIAYYLWARHLSVSYPPYHFTGGGNWLWENGLQEWFGEAYFLPQLYQHLSVWFWTKPVMALVVIGLLLPPPQGKSRWLFHWWMLGIVVYYFFGAQELVSNPTNLNIVNPAAAAMAGNVLLATASFARRIAGPVVSLVSTSAILLLVCGNGYRHVEAWGYHPYAESAYKLGLALRESTQPDDLVVTMAQDLGDPVAIYYSGRRGWVFPPAVTWSSINWSDGITDERQAIRLLEELRSQGADWFGVVQKQGVRIRKNNPQLAEYLARTFELERETPDWTIYRIP